MYLQCEVILDAINALFKAFKAVLKIYLILMQKKNTIKSNQIKSNQIKSNQIKSNQIKSNQIKSNQISDFFLTKQNVEIGTLLLFSFILC